MTLEKEESSIDTITSILDRRLPQPYEWEHLLPRLVREQVKGLARARITCTEDHVDAIDRTWIALLLPYRRGDLSATKTKKEIGIDIRSLYGDTAKLADLPNYVAKALELASEGDEVVLTGAGPIWLYLKIAHALHGRTKKLIYHSLGTGDVVIFDHNPS